MRQGDTPIGGITAGGYKRTGKDVYVFVGKESAGKVPEAKTVQKVPTAEQLDKMPEGARFELPRAGGGKVEVEKRKDRSWGVRVFKPPVAANTKPVLHYTTGAQAQGVVDLLQKVEPGKIRATIPDIGKSLMKSYIIPPAFRMTKTPGQVPSKGRLRTLGQVQALTNLGARSSEGAANLTLGHLSGTPERMAMQGKDPFARPGDLTEARLLDLDEPMLSPGSVTRGMGFNPTEDVVWTKFLGKALQTSPNEVVFRKAVMTRLLESGLEGGTRKALFSRALSHWRTVQKSLQTIEILTPEALQKSAMFIGPRGGKWADAKHTIPWDPKKHGKKITVVDMTGNDSLEAQATPESAATVATETIYFASGANRASDIRGFSEAGHPVGVALPEVMGRKGPLEELLQAAVPVFVDSGAFSEVEFGPEGSKVVNPISDTDWERRLQVYQELANKLGNRVTLVAPDMVGFPDQTLERLRKYRTQIHDLVAAGARVLVPLQGADKVRFYAQAMAILGLKPGDVIPALPMNKNATTPEEALDFVKRVQPAGLHLLGISPEKPVGKDLAQALKAEIPDLDLSADSNRIIAKVGTRARPGPIMRAKDAALDRQVAERFAEGAQPGAMGQPGDYTDMISQPSAWMTEAGKKRVAEELGFTPGERKRWMTDPGAFLQEDDGGAPRWENPTVQQVLDEEWARYHERTTAPERQRQAIREVFTIPSTPQEITPESVATDQPVMLASGQRVYSESGRLLAPFPKVAIGTKGKTANSLRRVDEWLLNEARKEVAGNDYQTTLLAGLDARRLSPSDRDTLNDILFGDERGARAKHLESPVAAPAPARSELATVGDLLTHPKPLQTLKGPTGAWFFVGTVPVELRYVRKDGQPMTEADLHDAATTSMPASKYRARVWATEAEAIAAAEALGHTVEAVKGPELPPAPAPAIEASKGDPGPAFGRLWEKYIIPRRQALERVKATVAVGKEYANDAGDRFGAVLQEISGELPYRVQWYDKHGLSGHTEVKDLDAATELLVSDLGINVREAPGSMDQWAIMTPSQAFEPGWDRMPPSEFQPAAVAPGRQFAIKMRHGPVQTFEAKGGGLFQDVNDPQRGPLTIDHVRTLASKNMAQQVAIQPKPEKADTKGMLTLGTHQDGAVTAYYHPVHGTLKFVDAKTGAQVGNTHPAGSMEAASNLAAEKLGPSDEAALPIGLEDFEERQEAKRDRLEAQAAKAAQRSESAHKRVEGISQRFEFGQPILVGHHSEKRARKDAERIYQGMKTAIEENKKAEHYAQRAQAVGTGGVSSEDPEAVKKLRLKVVALEQDRDRMKAINRAAKKAKGDLKAVNEVLKLTPDEIKAIERHIRFSSGTPDKPYPGYALTNLGATIRSTKERIENLLSEAKFRASGSSPDIEGPGFTVSENLDENRIQILFDSKPSSDVIGKLKGAGFHWSPSQGAWQRQLNAFSRSVAGRIAKELGAEIEPGPGSGPGGGETAPEAPAAEITIPEKPEQGGAVDITDQIAGAFPAAQGARTNVGSGETADDLRLQGYLVMSKSADLHPFGYNVVFWLNPKTKHPVVGYTPHDKTKPEFVARTYKHQVAIHQAIGAPVKLPAGEEAKQQALMSTPEELKPGTTGRKRIPGPAGLSQAELDAARKRLKTDESTEQLKLFRSMEDPMERVEIVTPDDLQKGLPPAMMAAFAASSPMFVGPRGGKWADPQHKIPFRAFEGDSRVARLYFAAQDDWRAAKREIKAAAKLVKQVLKAQESPKALKAAIGKLREQQERQLKNMRRLGKDSDAKKMIARIAKLGDVAWSIRAEAFSSADAMDPEKWKATKKAVQGLLKSLVEDHIELLQKSRMATPPGGKTEAGYTVKIVGGKRQYVKEETKDQPAKEFADKLSGFLKSHGFKVANVWAKPGVGVRIYLPGRQFVSVGADGSVQGTRSNPGRAMTFDETNLYPNQRLAWKEAMGEYRDWHQQRLNQETRELEAEPEVSWGAVADYHDREVQAIKRRLRERHGGVFEQYLGLGSAEANKLLIERAKHSAASAAARHGGRKPTPEEIESAVAEVTAKWGKSLSKAEPRGGAYYKRTPVQKAGAKKKWRYFYKPEDYDGRDDAHLDGETTGKAYLSKKVHKAIEGAGPKGCHPKALGELVKKFGAKKVAEVLRESQKGGTLAFKKGKFSLCGKAG